MFRRKEVNVVQNPVCTIPLSVIEAQDFKYFDKDGFELNIAEQKYYAKMNWPLGSGILNHSCWQEPWFELEKEGPLLLDHSMILHRAEYAGEAAEQLLEIKKDIPQAGLLLKTKQKWGFDFALDAVGPDGEVYEVLHIEYDNRGYDAFMERLEAAEEVIRVADWMDVANQVYARRDEWKGLTGFEQNHWKSNFVMGWQKAEYTEKSLAI